MKTIINEEINTHEMTELNKEIFIKLIDLMFQNKAGAVDIPLSVIEDLLKERDIETELFPFCHQLIDDSASLAIRSNKINEDTSGFIQLFLGAGLFPAERLMIFHANPDLIADPVGYEHVNISSGFLSE